MADVSQFAAEVAWEEVKGQLHYEKRKRIGIRAAFVWGFNTAVSYLGYSSKDTTLARLQQSKTNYLSARAEVESLRKQVKDLEERLQTSESLRRQQAEEFFRGGR